MPPTATRATPLGETRRAMMAGPHQGASGSLLPRTGLWHTEPGQAGREGLTLRFLPSPQAAVSHGPDQTDPQRAGRQVFAVLVRMLEQRDAVESSDRLRDWDGRGPPRMAPGLPEIGDELELQPIGVFEHQDGLIEQGLQPLHRDRVTPEAFLPKPQRAGRDGKRDGRRR